MFVPILFHFVEFSVPLSSLALLVPPLRLMSAVMWEVVRQRNIKHYGKLEEFVSMVTDAVPELMSKREGRLLSLGLRARVSVFKSTIYKYIDPRKWYHENIQIMNWISSRQLLNCCVQNIQRTSRPSRPTSTESDLLALRRWVFSFIGCTTETICQWIH